MDPLGYLEVLDRRGRVVARHAVTGEAITVGRGYDNDLILDDPYVSPHHLAIVRTEDSILARDLDSDNGLFGTGRDRVPHLVLVSGLVFRIGQTELRYQAIGAAVAPTLKETRQHRDLLTVIGTAPRRRLIVLGALVLFATMYYQSSYEEVTRAEAIGGAFGGLVLLGLWAGAWAFAGRVVSQQFRFWMHLTWAALISALFLVTAIVTEYFEFMFSWSSLVGLLMGLVALALFGSGLFGHFGIVGTMPVRRQVAVTAWITAGVVAAMSMFALAAEDTFSNEIPWSGTLKPVGVSLLPKVTVEDFRRRSAALQEEVDGMVQP
jgi:hypothetical protein